MTPAILTGLATVAFPLILIVTEVAVHPVPASSTIILPTLSPLRVVRIEGSVPVN